MSTKWFEVQVTCHKLVAVEIEDCGTDELNKLEAAKTAMDEAFFGAQVVETGDIEELNPAVMGKGSSKRKHYDEVFDI